MTIFEKLIQIYEKYHVCPNCLGRMFALLGTHTTNWERGTALLLSLTLEQHHNYLSGETEDRERAINSLKSLAERSNFKPAQKVLEREGFKYSQDSLKDPCFLCQNIFKKH